MSMVTCDKLCVKKAINIYFSIYTTSHHNIVVLKRLTKGSGSLSVMNLWSIGYQILIQPIKLGKKVFILVYFRWSNSLQAARVTRWGGMISTPDAVLQAVIKRALIDSGSPSHIVNELMENAHERRWPSGLSTLETRQLNRRQYENYVTKRIPGEFIRKEIVGSSGYID